MMCTLVYGLGSNVKHEEILSTEEAFRRVNKGGWLFMDVYFNGRLVYTTQGVAGYRYICDDCPYVGRK